MRKSDRTDSGRPESPKAAQRPEAAALRCSSTRRPDPSFGRSRPNPMNDERGLNESITYQLTWPAQWSARPAAQCERPSQIATIHLASMTGHRRPLMATPTNAPQRPSDRATSGGSTRVCGIVASAAPFSGQFSTSRQFATQPTQPSLQTPRRAVCRSVCVRRVGGRSVLMPSTPSAFQQVTSRTLTSSRVRNLPICAGQTNFCAGFDSRQLHRENRSGRRA
jgi:hypothetical protein